VCARGYLRAVVSPDVLIEAERNILDKLPADALARYRELVASTPFLVVSASSATAIGRYGQTFLEDAHVVASALASGSDYLLTLDRRLERRVNQASLSIIALSPKAFLQTVFPEHPEHEQARRHG
jgi:predicted nucleic acid-binding protein